MQLIPPIVLLVGLLVILWILLSYLPGEKLLTALSGQQLGVVVALVLFSLLLVTHLFVPQDWTADILKVLIGAVLGGAAAAAGSGGSEASSRSSVRTDGATFGDHAKIAGRDINETIERLYSDVANIKDAVFHQYQSIADNMQVDRGGGDLLINTVYERQPNDIARAVEGVVARWRQEGWSLRHVTSDYSGMDGLFLIFSRPGPGSVHFYHGSRMEAM